MKAVAVFPASRELKLIEQDEPSITQPQQVKLRILDVGICGTDREICAFEYGTPPRGANYLVLGHEALGQVVEVGEKVTGFAPGDLAIPMVRRPCSHARCRPCRTGHQDFCVTGDYTERGIQGAHGYLTEFIVEDACYMQHVPQRLREVAVLVEPLTIAEKALAQVRGFAQHRPPWLDARHSVGEQDEGYRALILGAGPVGLLGAMALRTAGFTTYIYSRQQEPDPRVAVAQTIGATYLSSLSIPTEEITDHTGPLDLVYEAVGHSRLALEVLRELGPNGIYILTGVPGVQDLLEADPATLLRSIVLKNQVVLGTVNAGAQDFTTAITDLEIFFERWPTALHSLVGERLPIEQAPRALQGRPASIKSVIACGAG